MSTFVGPLPPPSILEKYERVKPGFAERIMAMAESNLHSRNTLEQRTLTAYWWEGMFGQFCALVIGVVGLVVAGIVGYHGQQTAASVIGGSTLVGLVVAFITGKHRKPDGDSDDKKSEDE